MTNLPRVKKVTVRVNERDFPFVVQIAVPDGPFVVQIAVPDGGFECALGAINAWHRYSRNLQYRGPPYHIGEQEFRSWRFAGLEIAEAFRHRFGGEILPVTTRARTNRRPDPALFVSSAGDATRGSADQDIEHAGSTPA
jgi:hypothetical protein